MSTGHGRCEATDKVIFWSEKEARDSLTGALKSKRMRAYRCPGTQHYHNTKEEIVEERRTVVRSRRQRQKGQFS